MMSCEDNGDSDRISEDSGDNYTTTRTTATTKSTTTRATLRSHRMSQGNAIVWLLNAAFLKNNDDDDDEHDDNHDVVRCR